MLAVDSAPGPDKDVCAAGSSALESGPKTFQRSPVMVLRGVGVKNASAKHNLNTFIKP
jgi:hypothetical protein